MRTKLRSWLRAVTPTGVAALDGQGMVEYALILVLVALAVIGSVTLLGDSVEELANQIDEFIIGALRNG